MTTDGPPTGRHRGAGRGSAGGGRHRGGSPEARIAQVPSSGLALILAIVSWAIAVIVMDHVTAWPVSRCLLMALIVAAVVAGPIGMFPEDPGREP